jgi:NAD+ kinase
VITHGKPQTIGPALQRLEGAARAAGVELLLPEEELEKHHIASRDGDVSAADIAVVLGGDGTMLRALQQFRNSAVPVIGVNFGRVGFLASIEPDELEAGWWVAEERRTQGIATEAMRAAIGDLWGRAEADGITAYIEEGENEASRRVATKLGFAVRGQGRGRSGEPMTVYELRRDAWQPGG